MTDGATTDYWSRDLNQDEVFKGGLVLTTIQHANTFFESANKENEETSRTHQNESYAKKVKEMYQTDYGVAVTGWGRENLEDKKPNRKAWMSVAMPDGGVITKEVDYSRSQNPARWLLSLRVSDFVRRVILGLPELPERN